MLDPAPSYPHTQPSLFVSQLLWELARLPPRRRAAHLESLSCPPRIKQELRRMLPHLSDRVASFTLATEPAPPEDIDVSTLRIPGYTLGPRLGAGGMGVVHQAVQQQLGRAVAIKLLAPRPAHADEQAGIAHEARLLASLQHPGVAQVFDAGLARTDSGLAAPYIALELIAGATTLTEHLRQHQPTERATIELVLRVCDAVDHAHRRGVIHRDIKPSNILIDASAQPKLIDFGIAIAADPAATALPTPPALSQLAGTLPYIAPELLRLPGARPDVGCDVYALGVVLYESLCGRRPREHDPHATLGHMLADAAEPKAPEPRRHNPRAHPDLAAVLTKAAHPDPEMRYRTAEQLAQDLRRYLSKRPVLARALTPRQRTWRFAQRHRLGATLTAVLAAAIVLGSVTSTVLAIRAHRAGLAAMRRVQGFTHVTRFLVDDVFSSADPRVSRGPSIPVTQALGLATARLSRIGDPIDRASVTIRLAEIHDRIGEHTQAESLARASIAALLSEPGDDWARAELARARRMLARALSNQLRFREAAEPLGLAVQTLVSSPIADDSERAEALSAQASVLNAIGRHDDADRALAKAMAICSTLPSAHQGAHATALMRGAQIAESRDQLQAARQRYEHALRIRASDPNALPADLANTQNNLGAVLVRLGELEQARTHLSNALALRRQVLPPDHSNRTQSLSALAFLQLRLGDHQQAAELLTQVVETYARTRGPQDLYVAWTLVPLALAQQALGQHEPARASLLRAIEVEKAHDDPQGLANAQSVLGGLLTEMDQLQQAARALADAQETLSRVDNPNPALTDRLQERLRLLEQRRDEQKQGAAP